MTPNYYKFILHNQEYQVKDLIESANLSYHLGTSVAYILRAGKKTSLKKDDLIKAKTHIQFEIERLNKYPNKYTKISECIPDINEVVLIYQLNFQLKEAILNIFDTTPIVLEQYKHCLKIAIKLLEIETNTRK